MSGRISAVSRRVLLATIAALAAILGLAGVAAAVSDGNYRSEKQHCSGGADNSDRPKHVEKECKNFIVTFADGKDHEYGGVGLRQTADGQNPDPTPTPTPASSTTDPSSGFRAYMGADDNLDVGEHDSSEQMNNGPSDGGAIVLNVMPDSLTKWTNALSGGDLGYLLTHPTPLVDAGFGMCADGICTSVQTQRRVAFDGGAKNKSRSLANYEGKQWDPDTCAGPDDKAKSCGGKPLGYWAKKEGKVYAEPGFQFYEDPDPQGSPEGPYPLPAVYAGTCGVVLGGGVAPAAPPSPMTNKAGQVVVETGCPKK